MVCCDGRGEEQSDEPNVVSYCYAVLQGRRFSFSPPIFPRSDALTSCPSPVPSAVLSFPKSSADVTASFAGLFFFPPSLPPLSLPALAFLFPFFLCKNGDEEGSDE